MASTTRGPILSHILILLVAMLNLCILSYDASMINNLNKVKPYYDYFNLNSDIVGLNGAIISAGCIVGGPLVGPIVDRWGRKAGLLMGSLIVGRFIIGVATLVNGSIAPMWVMELASPKYRSALSNSVVTSVPFTSFLVSCMTLGIHNAKSDWAWRGIMFATEILARLHSNGNHEHPVIVAEIQEILGALEQEKKTNGGWKELIWPVPNLKRFSISVLVNIFYQILGGNMILYFSSSIIGNLRIENPATVIKINMGLLLFKTLCSVGGVFIIDWIGVRKPLIAGTSAIVALFGLLAGLSYLADIHPDIPGYAISALIVVALFLLAVSTSWMLLAYTYPIEVLKYSQRAKGVVVAQAIGYAFSFLNLYTAPVAIEKIAWRYYAINGGWDLGILLIVVLMFVETKGRTLEEMDELFEGVGYNDGMTIGQNTVARLEQEESAGTGSINKSRSTTSVDTD
ncbi:major facilitator superfamily domain-containing protein [Fusarium oxysporum Fo47]|uniref:major facilitator superfamily domain-containing protein n=1 Tax=Fusarium oxysporum Fo47 TaxID=660027 RepID=UPI0028698D0A|nr:major facilitator superfamily domain-containing protein [Fusarium oxysporum Fo47]QKD50425.2 major facilitator superfamily domain-containing protein [Fusarium oxysporum Fo47]